MNLETACSRLNRFVVESEDLYWRNWVGLEDEIDIAGLYERYRDAFAPETIQHVRKSLKAADQQAERHRLRAVLGQMTLAYLEYKTAGLQQEILKKEAQTTVDWKGEQIPVRSFRVRILNEKQRDIRREMLAAREKAEDEHINPLRLELVAGMKEAVTGLGYRDYIELCQETQDRDFYGFAAGMRSFLSETEPVYRRYLDRYLQQFTGTSLNQHSHSADIAAIMRCSLYDRFFPPETLLEVTRRTVGAMGFTLDKIHLDFENRPKKKPRPCVSAVNPPEDVRLTIYPVGGFEDYSGLLHEVGHAIHFVHERPDLDFIFKFWGDRGFTEGIAYLFQNITMNPVWLQQQMAMADAEELIRYNAFMGILRFRRLIGQFLYQLDLFSSPDLSALKQSYARYAGDAHQVVFDASDYLNFDMELYSAGYLRARMFECQLRSYLVRTFGEDWWRNKTAGDHLVTMFRDGRRSRAEDAVKNIGYACLSPAIYRERYEELLKPE